MVIGIHQVSVFDIHCSLYIQCSKIIYLIYLEELSDKEDFKLNIIN
jgi:hypothetical protein